MDRKCPKSGQKVYLLDGQTTHVPNAVIQIMDTKKSGIQINLEFECPDLETYSAFWGEMQTDLRRGGEITQASLFKKARG